MPTKKKLEKVEGSIPEEFGTVVNNIEAKEDEWEQKTKELTFPFQITVNLTPEERTRLDRICEDGRMTQEQYVSALVKEDLAHKIGRATITGPSKLNGMKTTKLVTGPSNGSWRTS